MLNVNKIALLRSRGVFVENSVPKSGDVVQFVEAVKVFYPLFREDLYWSRD